MTLRLVIKEVSLRPNNTIAEVDRRAEFIADIVLGYRDPSNELGGIYPAPFMPTLSVGNVKSVDDIYQSLRSTNAIQLALDELQNCKDLLVKFREDLSK